MLYLWLKAFHIVAVVTWVGGLLLVAVALAASGPRPEGGTTVWLAAVRRWDRQVTSPAMLAAWALGLTLALQGGWFPSGWLTAKLVLVLGLSGFHGVLTGRLRRLAPGGHSGLSVPIHGFGAPSILAALLGIVVLVILKPA